MKKLLLVLSFILALPGSLYALGIGGFTSVTYINHYSKNALIGGGLARTASNQVMQASISPCPVIRGRGAGGGWGRDMAVHREQGMTAPAAEADRREVAI